MSPKFPQPPPERAPDNPPFWERLERWKAAVLGFLDGPRPPKDSVDLTRRRVLRGLAAAGILAVGGKVAHALFSGDEGDFAGAEGLPTPQSDESAVEHDHRTIEFFGEKIEIEDEAQFDARLKEATQALLLKFTPRRKKELNENYWPRALEEFHQVLIRMGRYEPFIQEVATAMGLHPDVIAFFGIEAGFDPLKRSSSGYCGMGQVGDAAVRDVAHELPADYQSFAISKAAMNSWYDERYEPLHGIVNGLAYVNHLYKERVPETVQQLLSDHRWKIKEWLNKGTRFDKIEQEFGWPELEGEEARYERLVQEILGKETIVIVRPTFVIPAYNMGAAGLARLVFLNYLKATLEQDSLLRERRLSIFHLDPSLGEEPPKSEGTAETPVDASKDDDTDTTITGFDLDWGLPTREGEKQTALQEKSTYLWQAYAFHVLAAQWRNTPQGEGMAVDFKGKTYHFKKPSEPAPEYRDEIATWVSVEVPAGTDLVKLADHLELDERMNEDGTPVNRHHEAFRLNGNGAFVRAGAYYGDPKKEKFSQGMVTIQLPQSKVEEARTYLARGGQGTHVKLYEVQKGDTASGILRKLKRKNPTLKKEDENEFFDRIFWDYNRIGRGRVKSLQRGEALALPGDLEL